MTITPASSPSPGSATIAAAAARSRWKEPSRLTWTTVWNGSTLWAPRLPAVFSAQPMPAQVTAIRSPGPAAATAASTWAGSVTSQATNAPSSSPATASPRSASTSAIVTCAPSTRSRRAVAAPRPDAPPHTSALAPSIRMGRRLGDRAPRRGDGVRGAVRVGLRRAPARHGDPHRRAIPPARPAEPRRALLLHPRDHRGGRRVVVAQADERLVEHDVVEHRHAVRRGQPLGDPRGERAVALDQLSDAAAAELAHGRP